MERHLAILEAFPSVRYAFAYGSGVFKQPGLYSESPQLDEGPMLDLIFAVDDPVAWHREVSGDTGGREFSLFHAH
jgi:hypothetical protein